ncbi:MAG TPA: A/G-specific adenine glycosylase [Bacteroidales bacterium]
MSISSTLINWYLQKKRNLPWRNSENPYHIWISEIILQQTRVAQGIGYYERFITRFPDVKSLANADLEDVLKIWQGLGYYSRARNLHTGAKYVLQQLNGNIPADYEALTKIKGIGEYTAAAIGSFAFGLPVSVVDGNVNRLISRFFGIHEPVNSSSGSKKIKEIAGSIMDKNNPGIHNQAIMEFGALQCTIRNPDCSQCPLQNECYAFNHGETEILPVKIKQQKIRNRYFNYLVILYHNNSYLVKRSGKDIWEGLYEFPLIETELHTSKAQLTESPEWQSIFEGTNHQLIQVSPIYKHQLSHQTINAIFYLVKIENKLLNINPNAILIEKKDIAHYPVSKLIDNYLSTIDL